MSNFTDDDILELFDYYSDEEAMGILTKGLEPGRK